VFSVTFYDSAGALPGSVLATYEDVPYTKEVDPPPVIVYDAFIYTATLDTPFEAQPGVEYWVAVQDDLTGTPCSTAPWYWMSSPDSPPGDQAFVQDTGAGYAPGGYVADLAVCLYGSPLGAPINDCNTNGVPDECDLDCNDNCIPDDCEEEPVTCGDLDLKPGSCPNSFNRGSQGVLPVALMGVEDIDEYGLGMVFGLEEIDISSIRLSRADGFGGEAAPHEGPPGPKTVFEDAATPFEEATECECADLDGDGIVDLSMKFATQEVVAALDLDGLPAGALVPLVLTGNMAGTDQWFTTPIDCLRLVPPGTGGGVLIVESSLAGSWADAEPLDLTLDGGGFAEFQRTYPLGTVVTLTAEDTFAGSSLRGWYLRGFVHHTSSIQFTLTEDMTVKAIYETTPPWGHRAPVTSGETPEQPSFGGAAPGVRSGS
jgi:hypothetical protein